jgi:hypothetical protein
MSEPETRYARPADQYMTDDRDRLDIVDDASDDSFPASDPPNWATGQQHQSEDTQPKPIPSNRRGATA